MSTFFPLEKFLRPLMVSTISCGK